MGHVLGLPGYGCVEALQKHQAELNASAGSLSR
jgi:hypothetical protein